MKHYVCETHLPKSGPLRRYLGVDAENMREARQKLTAMLEKDEYIPSTSIKSVEHDKVAKFH